MGKRRKSLLLYARNSTDLALLKETLANKIHTFDIYVTLQEIFTGDTRPPKVRMYFELM